ncbi:MAG: ABC transporter ATP-binding protein [Pseudomonadota bacterium]
MTLGKPRRLANNTGKMSGDILLSATKLARGLGGKQIIKGIELSLRAGQILGLLGPNGAGKSTTLKMLTGVLAPDCGRVVVNGQDIATAPAAAKQHIGYLPEEAPLYLDSTVDEYLCYCARLRRITPNDIKPAVDRVKARCGLQAVSDRLIANLSKGFKQRVGIAQAIIHDPAVIVLDEPTNGLDPNQIRDVHRLVQDLAATSRALIISTHLLPEVQALCDSVVILHEGQIAFQSELEKSQRDLIVESEPTLPLDYVLGLEGVIEATQVSPMKILIRCNNRQQVCDHIVRYCVDNDVSLLELARGHSHLEQLFFDITCGDTPEIDD